MKRSYLSMYQLMLMLATATLITTSALHTPAIAQVKLEETSAKGTVPKFKGGHEALDRLLQEHLLPLQTTDEPDTDTYLILSFSVARDGGVSDLKVAGIGGSIRKPKDPADNHKLTDEPRKDARLTKAAIAAVKATNGRWELNRNDKAPVVLALHATFNGNDAPTGEIKPYTDPKENHVYKKADKAPAYKGGQVALEQSFNKNLRIPDEAKRENLSARITTTFIVEKDGSISNIRLIDTKFKKMIGPGAELDYMDASTFGIQNKTILARLSEATITAIKETSGNWEAGQQMDKNVRVEMFLPITFLSSDPPRATLEAPYMAAQNDEATKSGMDKPYSYVEEMPRYKAGELALQKFFGSNLTYPETARNNKIEGLVFLTFIVEKDGQLSSIEIAKGLSPDIDKEAIRVLRLTKLDWLPGKQGGVPVRVKFTVPVRFKLDSTKE